MIILIIFHLFQRETFTGNLTLWLTPSRKQLVLRLKAEHGACHVAGQKKPCLDGQLAKSWLSESVHISLKSRNRTSRVVFYLFSRKVGSQRLHYLSQHHHHHHHHHQHHHHHHHHHHVVNWLVSESLIRWRNMCSWPGIILYDTYR